MSRSESDMRLELAALRERTEAQLAKNVSLALQTTEYATDLLNQICDHPRDKPLPPDLDAQARRVVEATPTTFAQRLATYMNEDHADIYDLRGQMATVQRIGCSHDDAAAIVYSNAVHFEAAAADLRAFAAQLDLWQELRARGYGPRDAP